MTATAQRSAVVLGAGISGLAAARTLLDGGCDPEVVEACPDVGGLTRSMVLGGFSFDYTGHLLHLSRFASPAAVPFAGLRDEEWQRVQRRSYCYVGGKLVPAPLQYHIGELPPSMRAAAIASYNERPALRSDATTTFRDYVVSGFGQYLADLFLIPQNEKTMATSLDRLSSGAVKRFFPAPDEKVVRAGMAPGAVSPPEYNSRFWYPKRGGMQKLVDGLARGLEHVTLQDEAVGLDLPKRVLRTRSGRTIEWDRLLTSIPLRELCRLSGEADLRSLARQLTHSATVCINLGVRGDLGERFGDAQWIYVPDRDIPFYRVGAYSNISDGVCPPGCSSVYVEIGMPGDEIDRVDIAGSLEPRIIDILHDLGWVRREAIVCRATTVLRCAYVHHTVARDRVVDSVMSRFAEHDVIPIGRYGTWDYTSMEDSIWSGIQAAQPVLT